MIAPLHNPTDFGGLPVRTDSAVTFEPPAWARRVAGRDGPSLVSFDETNTAAPAVQNAPMRVVLEGRVGESSLGELSPRRQRAVRGRGQPAVAELRNL